MAFLSWTFPSAFIFPPLNEENPFDDDDAAILIAAGFIVVKVLAFFFLGPISVGT
jgi:hypothetical protein